MRVFLSGLPVLLCCILFMGAAGLGAPVVPSKNFYINDYADVIAQENRGIMLETAGELYERTGVQVVVLTVESFGEYGPDEYAKSVFDAWEIGGVEKNGVLILLSKEEKHILIHAGISITASYSTEMADKLAAGGRLGDAVGTCFFAVADSVYGKYGTADEEGEASVSSAIDESVSQGARDTQNTEKTQSTQVTDDTAAPRNATGRFYLVTVVLFMLILLRGVKISAKYRKKYNKPYYRRHIPVANRYSYTARSDDGDYPSGFGGLGNRKAIYGEDVDEADDAGIIQHDYEDILDDEEKTDLL